MKIDDAYLCGYYGMRNSGDDALLYAAALGAQKFLNVQKIRVSTPIALTLPHFGDQAATLCARQSFPGHNRLLHYFSAARSKRIIFGGGSVLHTAQDIRLKMGMMALSQGKEHLALGVGLGPFKNTEAEKACAEFLKRCSSVGVRDHDSYDIARAIAPNAPVTLTFDLAPLLLKHPDLKLKNPIKKGIAINLCPVKNMNASSPEDAQRLLEMVQVIKTLWQNTQEPIYLIDINGHAHEGDFKLHQRLAELLNGKVPVYRLEYNPNPLQLLQRLEGFKAVISMRLHGSILGFLANTPVMSLNYHSKCVGWCKQIGMPNAYQFAADKPFAHALSHQLLQGLQEGFMPCRLTPSQAVQQTLLNWGQYDESNIQCLHRCYTFV